MALKEFKYIQSTSPEVNKVQDNLRNYLLQLNKLTLSGNLLDKTGEDPIVIGTTTTLVPHGLGRRIMGWHLVDIQGDARVWRDDTSTANEELFLPLKASASVTIKLWVF